MEAVVHNWANRGSYILWTGMVIIRLHGKSEITFITYSIYFNFSRNIDEPVLNSEFLFFSASLRGNESHHERDVQLQEIQLSQKLQR